MRLPQRFRRVPNQEPGDDQDMILLAYPSQTKLDVRRNPGTYHADSFEPMRADAEHTAASCSNDGGIASHQKTWVERIEKFERRLLGTQVVPFLSGPERLPGKWQRPPLTWLAISLRGTVGRAVSRHFLYNNFVAGWRAGLLRAFLFSLAALFLNISIFAWLFNEYRPVRGTGLIRTANCDQVGNLETGIKIGLNIISKLILGASTYAMQGTTAPTRRELDEAHSKGKWLEIGTQSWRNLTHVSRRHQAIWSILALTSLPLHLVFNAVFFNTTESYQYAVAVVDQGFQDNTAFQSTPESSSPILRQFEQLEWKEAVTDTVAFGTSPTILWFFDCLTRCEISAVLKATSDWNVQIASKATLKASCKAIPRET
ncbi:hypothetical protein EJ07DRAFT_154029 [Lizonia empirigonia]|nr:hypothetical protein EJ07DRAFT_154029 [Lizonia empirigonia]